MSIHEPVLPEPTIVTVDGHAIATRVLEPSGPSRGDIVFCHGTPWSSAVWGAVAQDLRRDHRVFLWDMPGYGDSAMGPSVSTSLRAQAPRLVRLLDRWELDRPHVVAHDIGGAVALGAHLLHGAEYSDLLLWDIVTLEPWGSPFFRLVSDHSGVFSELPPSLHAALVREYISGALARDLPAEDIHRLVSPWLGEPGQAAFYRQIASLSAEDTRPLAERLGSVRCPTRIGWGAQDPWIPLEQAYRLQSLLAGSPDVTVLDDAGHLAPYEDPAAVSAVLRGWLADIEDHSPSAHQHHGDRTAGQKTHGR
ncbi:pimeloyl-ACP methyl ester carboxylesterase [Arthrobacter woluwensis]|uniref:alpha/beta fold hydrolase n=1 Tax=Arthrobacter woluwensis TaxID=156980 RepID=UPI0027849DD9|nr:alpha/beta hydrolase [Arthrobacter woluwensis]MDQ0709250.1 pimeloyl-ACP methyl ester carboxylesterase [Arthrobacter woluwensis]